MASWYSPTGNRQRTRFRKSQPSSSTSNCNGEMICASIHCPTRSVMSPVLTPKKSNFSRALLVLRVPRTDTSQASLKTEAATGSFAMPTGPSRYRHQKRHKLKILFDNSRFGEAWRAHADSNRLREITEPAVRSHRERGLRCKRSSHLLLAFGVCRATPSALDTRSLFSTHTHGL